MDDIEFLEEHYGEINGLYKDEYYKMGGWNGLLGAIRKVKERYKYKGEISIDSINKIF